MLTSEYLGLVNFESMLIQEIEIFDRKSNCKGEVAFLKAKKAEVSKRREQLSKRIKKEQQVVPTLTARNFKRKIVLEY